MLLVIDDFKDEKIQNPESRNSESGFKIRLERYDKITFQKVQIQRPY